MAILQFANNAASTLAQNITGVDTTIHLAPGTGNLFPIPDSNHVFYATIYNVSSTVFEIVLVTARSGDILTVVRAQEGTVAESWLVGNTIGMYPTAATMNQLIQIDQLQNGAYTVVQAGGTANALTCQIPSDLTAIPDGMTIVVKPIYQNTGAATLQVTLGTTILSAVPIVKGYNLPIVAEDIPSAGYPVQLIYSAIYGAWVMQMPSTLISPPLPPTYNISYTIIAGGGGGGCPAGVASSGNGGGGAGGMYQSSLTALSGSVLTLSVGGGGSGSSSSKGTNSYISGVVTGDINGGSGGGGYGNGSAGGAPIVPSQGNSGGAGNSFWGTGGGGGGAGAAGDAGSNAGGAGGSGEVSTITGTVVTYAGGGGGCGFYTGDPPYSPGGAGGSGGGGAGGSGGGGSAGNGVINSGSGGGAARGGSGNGGSGVIILSIPTARYTGVTTGLPLVSTVGSNTILQYNNSGTYTA
jgi:hypothetical protein